MVRKLLIVLSTAAFLGASAPAMAGGCKGCTKVAEAGEGFCCGKGKSFGVDLTSKKLHAALVGHKFDLEKIHCPGCKTAAKTGGSCEHCKVHAADGKFYHSSVAHALAKGKLRSASVSEMKCTSCKTAHAENGWCSGCSAGFIANRLFESKTAHTIALAAYNVLKEAVVVASKCERCAIAMVTDGTCDACKVKFKDGKAVKKAAG